MTGTANAEAGGEREEVTVELGAFEFTELRDGPDVYTDVEPFLSLETEMPPGTRWLKYNQDEVYDAIGLDGDLARELQNMDPARAVEVMYAVAEGIELEGRARVRGVATTRYTMVVPFDGLLAQVADEDVLSDEVTDLLEDVEASWEVWIDDADRVRKAHIQLDLGVLPDVEIAHIDLTMEVVSLERGLRVELPLGPDVYDATEDMLEEIDGRSAEELFAQ